MSEIVYVQRNASGAIQGVFANKQPGLAEEQLASDHPDVVAFIDATMTPPPPQVQTETTVLYDHENRIRAIEGTPPLSLTDFTDKMKGR